MRKNVLVARYNKIEIVFTDTFKKDKDHFNDKVSKIIYTFKKDVVEGKVYFPENSEFKDSFEYMYNQLKDFDTRFNVELRNLLAVKYFAGVM